MIDETPAQLVAHLSDVNGWWRDTAQQLLVQRNDKSVVPALKALVLTAPDARTRTQALWTLAGMKALDSETVSHALGDADAGVRLAGVRGAETFLAKGQMLDAVLKLADDSNLVVRHQVAASLGELPAASRLAPVAGMLRRFGGDAIAVDAAVSGLKGMEADALAQLIAQPGANADPVEMLAGAAGKSRDVAQVNMVIGFATDAKQPDALRLAMLNGVNTGLIGLDARRFGSNVAGGKAGGGIADTFVRARPQVKPLELAAEPAALTALAAGTGDLAAAAKTVVDDLTWPGKPVPPAPKNTRTPEEDKLFASGRGVYETNCTGCHQAGGEGAPRIAAALAGSKLVTGRPDMALRCC